jgi:hypothetical protein
MVVAVHGERYKASLQCQPAPSQLCDPKVEALSPFTTKVYKDSRTFFFLASVDTRFSPSVCCDREVIEAR